MIAILLSDTRGILHEVFHLPTPCSPEEVAGIEECARCYGFTVTVRPSRLLPSASDVCAEVADLTDASTSEVDVYTPADRSQPAVEVHAHSGSPEVCTASACTAASLDDVLDHAFACMEKNTGPEAGETVVDDWEV